jgi:hypothetical protein
MNFSQPGKKTAGKRAANAKKAGAGGEFSCA